MVLATVPQIAIRAISSSVSLPLVRSQTLVIRGDSCAAVCCAFSIVQRQTNSKGASSAYGVRPCTRLKSVKARDSPLPATSSTVPVSRPVGERSARTTTSAVSSRPH